MRTQQQGMVYILDTNVLVAAFVTRGLCQDVLRLVLAEHSLLAGETILDELERTLTVKFRTPARRAREAVTFIREHGEVAAPANPAPWPENDPDDRWIVAAALDGAADVIGKWSRRPDATARSGTAAVPYR